MTRKSHSKKLRWVVGVHACREVILTRPHSIEQLFLKKEDYKTPPLVDFYHMAKNRELRFVLASKGQLDSIGHGHQGVALGVNESPLINWEELKGSGPFSLLIVDGIEDPQNLGAMIRTLWLMGIKGVVAPKDHQVDLTVAVNKVASGGAEHVPFEQHAQLGIPISKLKDLGFWIFGLDPDSKTSLWTLSLPKKVAWVVGGEQKGIRISTKRLCDEMVQLPMVEPLFRKGISYNASVSVALAMGETFRQNCCRDPLK